MPKLTWISDDNLTNAVATLLRVAQSAKHQAEHEFGKNVIDPFSAIFEMAGFGMTYDEWIKSEKARQAQKTLQNFIGDFHQIVLGHCNGWENMKMGGIIDLHSEEKKIIAEVKNKYNTVSGGKLSDLYWSLDKAVMPKFSRYKDYTAYYVAIIPNKPKRFNIPFTPSDKEKGSKCPENNLVRYIDGASFYHLVTGEENALENLFDSIPNVIAELTGSEFVSIKDVKSLFNMAYGSSASSKLF